MADIIDSLTLDETAIIKVPILNENIRKFYIDEYICVIVAK